MTEPLEGIRVLEMATALQGPAAALYLSDMGADVVKVEPPEGDPSRLHQGVGNPMPETTLGSQFLSANRGKRSVSLDAHDPDSKEAIYRLVEQVDVFLSNFREVALERMGLGYDALKKRNPGIIYAIVNGFGPDGPDAEKRMLDGAAQARGGLASVTGYEDGPPLLAGTTLADTAGAMQLALAVMTALLARERHGVGQKVNCSSYGAQLWLQMWEITHTALTGHLLSRTGPHHPNVPGSYGIYGTADGKGIFLAFPTTEEAWQAFCAFGGDADLGFDERWNTVQKRMGMSGDLGDTAAQLRPLLTAIFASKTMAEWREFLDAQPEIIWDAIATYEDVLNDPQAAANGYIAKRELPGVGERKVVGNLVKLSETPGTTKASWPELGQQTEEVLLELGYDWDAITLITDRAREALREKFIAQGVEPPY